MPILTKGQKKSNKAFLERKADKLSPRKRFYLSYGMNG